MGGGSLNCTVSSGEESSTSNNYTSESVADNYFSDVETHKVSILEASEKQRLKVYEEVKNSYENLQSRTERLAKAKRKVLSYTPGSWNAKTCAVDMLDFHVPETTSLILIGPKGAGKSSLVNKISAALEDNEFGFGRAQVSYNSSSSKDGTHFLYEFMIPQKSSSFCLYDTRSLSDDPSENEDMLKQWMTEGIRHGKVVKRRSDGEDLNDRLEAKGRRKCFYHQAREVNFVIFVVNTIDVLKAIVLGDEKEKHYSKVIATAFDNPFLSFKDDKPVIVMTHGDLLSVPDRVKIRLYLGELLNAHPATQIFDIPDGGDFSTTLTIVDMLNYCLERADRNLSYKEAYLTKEQQPVIMCTIFVMVFAITYLVERICFRSNNFQP